MLGPVTALYRTIGNIGSGQIGAYYEQIFPLLNQRVTPRLLNRIAILETRWWNRQPGFPGYFGSVFSSRNRAGLLRGWANFLGWLKRK